MTSWVMELGMMLEFLGMKNLSWGGMDILILESSEGESLKECDIKLNLLYEL